MLMERGAPLPVAQTKPPAGQHHDQIRLTVSAGYPDVSANGAFLEIYNNLTLEHFFGTSLASPIFASVVTLLNEERTAIGKGPIGFVNPVLYAHPEVLNDIVNGSNPNCGSAGFETAYVFPRARGLVLPYNV